MTPRHHLNDPGLILWSSFFHDFSWFWPNVRYFRMIPSSSWNKLDTILKYIKNDYDRYRVWFIWLRLCLDNLNQKGSDLPRWRNPLWAVWRLPLIWRRALRTIHLRRLTLDNLGHPSRRGRGCEALSSRWHGWQMWATSSKNHDFSKSSMIILDHLKSFLLLPDDS